jgi:hypothetical protein
MYGRQPCSSDRRIIVERRHAGLQVRNALEDLGVDLPVRIAVVVWQADCQLVVARADELRRLAEDVAVRPPAIGVVGRSPAGQVSTALEVPCKSPPPRPAPLA